MSDTPAVPSVSNHAPPFATTRPRLGQAMQALTDQAEATARIADSGSQPSRSDCLRLTQINGVIAGLANEAREVIKLALKWGVAVPTLTLDDVVTHGIEGGHFYFKHEVH